MNIQRGRFVRLSGAGTLGIWLLSACGGFGGPVAWSPATLEISNASRSGGTYDPSQSVCPGGMQVTIDSNGVTTNSPVVLPGQKWKSPDELFYKQIKFTVKTNCFNTEQQVNDSLEFSRVAPELGYGLFSENWDAPSINDNSRPGSCGSANIYSDKRNICAYVDPAK
jgi:hypothetical protein